MKVLQVNKLYYPHIGGVEKVVQELAEGLAEEAEVRVLACQPKGIGKREVINGIPVYKAGSLGTYWSMPVSPSFPRLLHKQLGWADLAHFHFPFPLGDLSYLLVKRRVKVKTVLTWHSDIVKQKSFLRLYEPFLYKFLDAVDQIILTSPAPLENSRFLKNYRDKCKIIPLGIRNFWFEAAGESEEAVQLPCDKTVLFVGRLCYYKGVEYLLEAMQDVSANLVIIGNGELREELEEKAKRLGISERTFFLGFSSDEELRYWYHRADVFALPSVEPSEAFALVQAEAMAAGTPVVNTNLPTGVPFVSLHNETGLTVEPRKSQQLAEALNTILNNPSLAASFGEKAKERAKSLFSVEQMLQSTLSLYKELIEDA